MADTAASFWKSKFDAINARMSELEYENHSLRANSGIAIKQDPEKTAQLDDLIIAQDRQLVEAGRKNKKLEQELLTEQHYVSNLKARVTAMKGAEEAMKVSGSGTKSTLAQERKKVAALEDQIYDLKMELRNVKVDKSRLEFDVKQLREQNPGSTLKLSWPRPNTPASVHKQTAASALPAEKRKWEHVNTNVAADPKSSWKTKSQSKCNDADGDDSEPDLDDLPLAQRKGPAIKKENREDEMPLALRRKTMVPTSQMAKIKLEPGTAPKAAPTPKKKGHFIEDSSEDDEPLAKKRKERAAGGGAMAYHKGLGLF